MSLTHAMYASPVFHLILWHEHIWELVARLFSSQLVGNLVFVFSAYTSVSFYRSPLTNSRHTIARFPSPPLTSRLLH